MLKGLNVCFEVLRVQRGLLDEAYLNSWATRLALTQLLNRASRYKSHFVPAGNECPGSTGGGCAIWF